MDELNGSKSKNPNETSTRAKLSEKKGRPNIHQDFTNLTSQLQVMSESLAACHTFSRHRFLKKEYNTSSKRYEKLRRSTPVKSFKESGELQLRPSNRHDKDILVNYAINNNDFLHLRKSKTFISQEEILTEHYSDDGSQCSEKLEKYASNSNMSREFPVKNSKVGMYDYREVDSGRLILLLERELETLAKLAPSVTLITSNIKENLSHCQECHRCHEKISSSLPWILNRIQKLIKYVTTRRQEAYLWPNDFSYLRINFSKSSFEEKASSSSSSRICLIPEVNSTRLVGKLEKVDPVAVSEDNPGVQILLEVKPEVQKKKFLYPARPEDQSKWAYDPSFPAVHLKERKSTPVVEVLKSTAKPRIVWERKREVAFLQEYSASFLVLHLRNLRTPASVAVRVGEGRLIVHEKTSPSIIFERVLVENEQAQSPGKSLLSFLISQSKWNIGQLPCSAWKQTPNAKETFSEQFRTDSSKLVRDLFTEAKEEEMQVQKVNELEEEVKELKDLMLEVHKNQTELGKLLLEKNVFSQLMVKLTDPKMLDEENKTLKKASSVNAPSTSSSTVALQMKVDCLKRKCALKNRLIMTLLRGLRSNVPKELWEEVVAYAFDDSESVDEFDSEKINEFIRQTSLLLTNEEKERKLAPSPSRTELQSAEEEPNVKGIMGAEVEDSLKNLSCYENQASAKSKGVSSRLEGPPSKIWAFPILNVSDYTTDTALRKLENQISILNLENERLWHQVNELRELLKNSVNEMNMFQSELKISKVRTSGKTINLVIQIAEKDARRSKNGGYFPRSDTEITDARSKSSPIVGIAQSESVTAIHEAERENSPYESDRKMAFFTAGQSYRMRSKSDRRRSENDLNCVDDVNLNTPDYKQENEKLRGVLRERVYPNSRVQGLLVRTPHPSAHEMFQNFKPVIWVPSKHIIPEVSDAYGAGPSRKYGEITNLLQKPSLMELAEIQSAGMYATMSNERELQTIPENDPDLSSPQTSRGVSQAIQRLRTRVRSLHKDITVLRLKNDRIDKLLDRLMDDVVENSHNYEELESSFSSLKSRLG